MNYKLEQVLPGQVRLLFALDKEDTFEKNKIGHVRGDFGRSGDRGWKDHLHQTALEGRNLTFLC